MQKINSMAEKEPFNQLKEMADLIGWEAPLGFDFEKAGTDWEVGERFKVRIEGDGQKGKLVFEGLDAGKPWSYSNSFEVRGKLLFFPKGITEGGDSETMPPGTYTPLKALEPWITLLDPEH